MGKIVLAVLGATAIGISLTTSGAAQSVTPSPSAMQHFLKGHFSPVPRLKRSNAGADQPKSDPRFEQMRDPCMVEG